MEIQPNDKLNSELNILAPEFNKKEENDTDPLCPFCKVVRVPFIHGFRECLWCGLRYDPAMLGPGRELAQIAVSTVAEKSESRDIREQTRARLYGTAFRLAQAITVYYRHCMGVGNTTAMLHGIAEHDTRQRFNVPAVALFMDRQTGHQFAGKMPNVAAYAALDPTVPNRLSGFRGRLVMDHAVIQFLIEQLTSHSDSVPNEEGKS